MATTPPGSASRKSILSGASCCERRLQPTTYGMVSDAARCHAWLLAQAFETGMEDKHSLNEGHVCYLGKENPDQDTVISATRLAGKGLGLIMVC